MYNTSPRVQVHRSIPMKVKLIEQAAEIVGDNQLLVNIVSKRVQQLNHGADPYVPTTPEMQSGDSPHGNHRRQDHLA